jgi:hypothetical protein
MDFGDALKHLKANAHDKNAAITRKGWYNTEARPMVKLQVPDQDSFMTEPYLYMKKTRDGKEVRFPLDLSCESMLATDWLLHDDSIIIK